MPNDNEHVILNIKIILKEYNNKLDNFNFINISQIKFI